jgi:hypothetical protein
MEIDNTKSYKPIGGYFTILFITSSFIFSCYSFIKVLIDPVIFVDPTLTDFNLIKKCNVNFTLNLITNMSTIQYIFMILSTMCDCFNYNVSKTMYKIFYSSYVMTNIISCIAFVINIKCFNFFKYNYNYYYISIVIQFSICLISIVFEFLDWLCCSSHNNKSNSNSRSSSRCVFWDECCNCLNCLDCLIDCFEKSDKDNENETTRLLNK